MSRLLAPGTAAARVLGLARANALLMVRNKLTLVNAVLIPLTPVLWGINAEGDAVAATIVSGVLLMSVLFPVFYNVLSLAVTRRDELVLKRLRTGEVRDHEQLLAVALPGFAVALAVGLLLVPLMLAIGQSLPANPLLFLLTVVLSAVLLACLAFWTASWTPTAESAQLTSLPVLVLIVLGSLGGTLPERWERVAALTPGHAFTELGVLAWVGKVDDAEVSFAQSWVEGAQPLAVLAAWTVMAVVLVRRSFRWEPRA